ncbi:MAG TPA: hypothetical protein VGD99_04175 [Anaerolineae bacterium]
MPHLVTSLNEAETALDYFNGFHDGFIKQLAIISHDRFEARGVQASGERLALEITLAHYNYQQDTKPAQQLIKVRFFEVMNLSLEFSGLSYEWSINHATFSETQRTLEDGRTAACLGTSLVQSRLNSQREWELHEDVRFTFSRAEFEEL